MASTGKKGKKAKGKVISLQSFLSNGEVPVGTTQVAKNIRNLDGNDSDEGLNVHTVVCQLPTAPRAKRIFDDNSIPQHAPFIAYITNLPFDVKEDDIYEYFNNNNVKSVRLPREDGETGRVRGFGYVEFNSRDDLIQSLGIRDPTIKGRRIRIDLSNENEQSSRQRGSKRNNDSTSNVVEGKDLSNWRLDNNTKRDLSNYSFERNFKDPKFTSDDNKSPGSWRIKDQNLFNPSPFLEHLHQNDQNECHVDISNTDERPKLNLKPRTLPLPELDAPLPITLESKNNDSNSLKFTGVSAEKVFGSAKPVDTSARDLEIEERLAGVRRQDNLQKVMMKTTSDLKELNFAKDNNVKTNNQNWRQQSENMESWKNKDRKSLNTDAQQEYVKENRKKYQYKSEGYEGQKQKEGKRKDTIKNKNERKPDRNSGQNVCNPSEHALTTNKYSGLDDDSD